MYIALSFIYYILLYMKYYINTNKPKQIKEIIGDGLTIEMDNGTVFEVLAMDKNGHGSPCIKIYCPRQEDIVIKQGPFPNVTYLFGVKKTTKIKKV